MAAAKKAPPKPTMPGGGYKDYGKGAFEGLWQWRSWMVQRSSPAYPTQG